MTLVKRNYENWDNLLDELFGKVSVANNLQQELNIPPVNIQESKDSFRLDVVAPGLQKQDFKLSVDAGLLTIAYEKKNDSEEKAEKLHRQEFSIKSFKRTFTLDEKIDADSIGAKYENGILQVTLPKKEEVKLQPKAITIE